MNKQPNQKFQFDSIDTALADIKAGNCVVVVDDEHRETKETSSVPLNLLLQT